MSCSKCGNNAMTEAVVSTCPRCGHESHDYALVDRLRCQLATYQAAYRRLEKILSLETNPKLVFIEKSYHVSTLAVKEAMLLEPELFPIGEVEGEPK